MPYVTLSLSEANKKKFKELAEKEHRGKSNMLVVMLDFYLEHKDKIK